MEPKLSTPNLGPETSPIFQRQSYEQHTDLSPSETPETRKFEGPERSQEVSQGEINSTPVLPPPIVFPQPPAPVANDASTATVSSNTDAPLVANDDDLIEREWVDKAKKIIIDTKEDPYRREKEVTLLQSDYLKKRYGRELGSS